MLPAFTRNHLTHPDCWSSQPTCRMRSLLPWAARISAPGAFPREANVFLYLAPLHWNAYPPGR